MQNLCCRNVLNVKFPKIVAEKFAFYNQEISSEKDLQMEVFFWLPRLHTKLILCPNVSNFEFLFQTKNLQVMKINHLQILSVPWAGVEPARVAPLVFETSASTDSATKAFRRHH